MVAKLWQESPRDGLFDSKGGRLAEKGRFWQVLAVPKEGCVSEGV
jgi:hypothetical protein